jgi:hypothetical protein
MEYWNIGKIPYLTQYSIVKLLTRQRADGQDPAQRES